jgi:hypothetical protein
VNAAWRFNAARMITFRTFFSATINDGTDWFTITLNIGDGFQSYTARFIEPYKAVQSAFDIWDVMGSLEIENA